MKTLIIIPTYNERENILELLTQIHHDCPEAHLLFVDDNSLDGTAALIEQSARENPQIHFLKRPGKRGLGPAYVAGFQWALERDFELIFEMDADLSHSPRYLPVFLSAIQDYDMVVGSRWIRGGGILNWPWTRSLLSFLASLYARAVLGVSVRDVTAGFVCYRRRVIEEILVKPVESDGYSFQIEMKYRALQSGFSLCEIPIVFADRTRGKSKISREIIFEALRIVWKLRFERLPVKPRMDPAQKTPQEI